MSSLAKNTPMMTVANSGAEEPAAMKVAPATSGDSLSSDKDKRYNEFIILINNINIKINYLK